MLAQVIHNGSDSMGIMPTYLNGIFCLISKNLVCCGISKATTQTSKCHKLYRLSNKALASSKFLIGIIEKGKLCCSPLYPNPTTFISCPRFASPVHKEDDILKYPETLKSRSEIHAIFIIYLGFHLRAHMQRLYALDDNTKVL